MKYEFLAEADDEFREAARYYEREAPGVGLAFITEVHRAISFVLAHPRTSKKVRNRIRSKLLVHFPYNVYYTIESDVILIIAVAHQKRRPAYWQKRLKSNN